ncbi:MAG: histidine phosphatase family protein [Actinomycetota bacterium]
MSERRLYLIRHGKADHRSTRQAETPRGSTADPPLDEIGRDQARALARRLGMMPSPAAIYCSTLTRARETIAPYLEATGRDVVYLDDLAEWHAGDWELKEFEELLTEHPEMPARVLLQDPVFVLAPNSEPVHAFRERVVAAVEGTLATHPDGDVWIVCHGGVINAYVGSILGVEEQEMFFLPANASINTVKVDGTRRTMWFLGDDTHYTSPELFPDP